MYVLPTRGSAACSLVARSTAQHELRRRRCCKCNTSSIRSDAAVESWGCPWWHDQPGPQCSWREYSHKISTFVFRDRVFSYWTVMLDWSTLWETWYASADGRAPCRLWKIEAMTCVSRGEPWRASLDRTNSYNHYTRRGIPLSLCCNHPLVILCTARACVGSRRSCALSEMCTNTQATSGASRWCVSGGRRDEGGTCCWRRVERGLLGRQLMKVEKYGWWPVCVWYAQINICKFDKYWHWTLGREADAHSHGHTIRGRRAAYACPWKPCGRPAPLWLESLEYSTVQEAESSRPT